MIIAPPPVKTRVQWAQLNNEEIIINSPRRLGRGGRARFARQEINHHVVIKGKAICMPRARSIVRVWVRS